MISLLQTLPPHNTQQTQAINSHALSGIQTRHLGSQAAADLRLRLHGYLYQHLIYIML